MKCHRVTGVFSDGHATSALFTTPDCAEEFFDKRVEACANGKGEEVRIVCQYWETHTGLVETQTVWEKRQSSPPEQDYFSEFRPLEVDW